MGGGTWQTQGHNLTSSWLASQELFAFEEKVPFNFFSSFAQERVLPKLHRNPPSPSALNSKKQRMTSNWSPPPVMRSRLYKYFRHTAWGGIHYTVFIQEEAGGQYRTVSPLAILHINAISTPKLFCSVHCLLAAILYVFLWLWSATQLSQNTFEIQQLLKQLY